MLGFLKLWQFNLAMLVITLALFRLDALFVWTIPASVAWFLNPRSRAHRDFEVAGWLWIAFAALKHVGWI